MEKRRYCWPRSACSINSTNHPTTTSLFNARKKTQKAYKAYQSQSSSTRKRTSSSPTCMTSRPFQEYWTCFSDQIQANGSTRKTSSSSSKQSRCCTTLTPSATNALRPSNPKKQGPSLTNKANKSWWLRKCSSSNKKK